MIKLIASDLDGTLLPPDKVMPSETFALIEKLYERGILFVPASGRQLPNLQKMFAPVLQKIAIIAENGGLCYLDGKVIYANPTPAESVKYALDIIRNQADLYPLLSCADCAYYESDYAPFIGISKKSYSSIEKADLDKIAAQKSVIKISVWDGKPPCAEHGGVILPPKIKGLRTMVSGYDWLDVSALSANKGNALSALLKHLGIDRSECMAFGDHMNDLEMLEACGHPYVTENAFSGLKEKIKSRVPSNAEYGVITKIKELL